MRQIFSRYDGPVDPKLIQSTEYMQVVVPDANAQTRNTDIDSAWQTIHRDLSAFCQLHDAHQPQMTIRLVTAALEMYDRALFAIGARVESRLTRAFVTTFGDPVIRRFVPYPIAWCGVNDFAREVQIAVATALYQLIHVQSNVFERGLVPGHATLVTLPLINSKVGIMKHWFDLEVQGDLSADELAALLRDKKLQPMLRRGISSEYDIDPITTRQRDEEALTDTTGGRPDEAARISALSGIDAWTWTPSQADLIVLAGVLERMSNDGPLQIPVSPVPLSTIDLGSASPAGSTLNTATGGLPTGSLQPFNARSRSAPNGSGAAAANRRRT